MQSLLDKYSPLRAPDAPGGAAPAAAPAAPPAAAPPAGDGGQPPAATPPAAGDPPPVAPAAGPYRPDGLPETMFGKDDRETMDKMHAALKGYRERDSSVPDKPEAYREMDLAGVPDAIKPHLEGLAKDPLFDAVSKVAMEEKIPVATLQKLTTALYTQAAEAGILEPALDPAAERAKLLPESAKDLPKDKQDAAIEARLQQNEYFVKLFMKPGADGKAQLDTKVGEHALLMLMDTAEGNQFLEFFASKMTGADRPQPFNGGSGNASGADTRAALKARMAAPEMRPGHPSFNQANFDALMADYKKVVGD